MSYFLLENYSKCIKILKCHVILQKIIIQIKIIFILIKLTNEVEFE